MLDLRLLQTFREVATRGSFSAAAEALSFTQPAVSQHVAKLERHLGTRLLERDARGVRPTRAGQAMLRHAESLLDTASRAEAEVRAEAGLHVPELRLGAFPTAAAGIVPMALRELRTAMPEVRPRLRILEPEPALDELAVGRLDVALVICSDVEPEPDRAGITAELIFVDPMLVALPAGHRLARRPAVELDDLRDEDLLVTALGGTCADSNILLRAFHRAGFAPNIHFQSEDYQALLGLTASGMGVTIVPSLAGASLRTDVAVRPFAGGRGPQRRILAAVRDGTEDAYVTAALDALRLAGRRLALGTASPVAA